MTRKVQKTEEQWRQELTPEQYAVCRQKGTEPPFSGALHKNKAAGEYRCVCCGAPLFHSQTKYDSGSGWPSFWAPADPANVDTQPDDSLMMRRTEVVCSHCGAHLGHVFDDGPPPSGKRYCINAVALDFVKSE